LFSSSFVEVISLMKSVKFRLEEVVALILVACFASFSISIHFLPDFPAIAT
jgi:hypothetical protein